jgi:transketolase
VDVAYNGFAVVLCGMSPGMTYGELGPTHHSTEDLSWLRAIDGLAIVVPADPAQTSAAVADTVVGNASVPMRMLGVTGFAPTGTAEFLFDHFGLNAKGIVAAALEIKAR